MYARSTGKHRETKYGSPSDCVSRDREYARLGINGKEGWSEEAKQVRSRRL